MGDRDIMPIQVAVMVKGHGTKVDHCVFSNCEWAAIFYYAKNDEGYTLVRNSSLHHSIITDCNWGALWTSYVDSDFTFYNNVVTNCPFFWIKNHFNQSTYSIENSVVTNVDIYNGAWIESNDLVEGDYEFTESNVIRTGDIHLVKWDRDSVF